MKNKKILGHRRSHSTSDAHEHATQDISPTSPDTESQLQQEEFCSKEKKGSQKKLKFPNIVFKMHRTKAEAEEKQRLEIKTVTPTKKDKIRKEDVSMETPEIPTVQYSASYAYETKAGEIQDNVKKDLKDMGNGLPIYTKKYPEVEIHITKQKDQIATSKPTTATSQIPPITTQISKPTSEIQTPGLKDIQSKQIPQALPRTRKKKQKSSSEQKSTKISLQHPGEGITNTEMRDHLEHTSVQIKGLEIKTTKKETGKTKQEKEMNEELKESEIPSSEIKTASFGFSLLKVKIPESHVKLDMPVKLQSYTEYKHEVSQSEVHQPKLSDANLGVAIQKTDTVEFKLSGKSQSETDESNDVISSSVSLPKLKTFTVEVQPSSKLGDTQSDKQPEEIAVSPLSKDDEIGKIPEDEEKDMKDQKEKTDSKRSSGRFKFWLPSIGFSSSVDDTGSDSKPEVQKSIPEETQPVDSSASDTDSSKQTEKTGWFRFPKLGFSSPSKKAKNIDKEEETNLKEMKTSDDESPSEKPETFFDAEESLTPKEETIKGEENETTGTSSNVHVSGAIVTSSARTELILLERERASQQSILEETTK
ncbi:hypothetical protein KIL84_002225 [Mauremys mutica]|uniref:Uncharacterized protein n=1 Tax=Mauremys mutica TaxID=74926 RepID=A0A9D3WP73_9SAUR|nr:hypothetical protein KIL84_002225 [Mauremys mutica]